MDAFDLGIDLFQVFDAGWIMEVGCDVRFRSGDVIDGDPHGQGLIVRGAVNDHPRGLGHAGAFQHILGGQFAVNELDSADGIFPGAAGTQYDRHFLCEHVALDFLDQRFGFSGAVSENHDMVFQIQVEHAADPPARKVENGVGHLADDSGHETEHSEHDEQRGDPSSQGHREKITVADRGAGDDEVPPIRSRGGDFPGGLEQPGEIPAAEEEHPQHQEEQDPRTSHEEQVYFSEKGHDFSPGIPPGHRVW